jgi:hypothetical protein
MSITLAGPIAYLEGSASSVYFSKGSADAGTYTGTAKGTATPVKEIQNILKVAPWGEDNRFPQNIERQMAYCGVGKSALDWKARALYGNGIIPGKVVDYEDEGKKEIFQPLKRSENKEVYEFIENRRYLRFMLEFLQDWTWYNNCFPEMIFSNDGSKITGIVHQESCDSRYMQMNDQGEIETAYLSKLWGAPRDQYATFDPEKKLKGLSSDIKELTEVDNKFIKALHCVDMYDPLKSLKAIAEKLKSKKGLKSAILPVNYPSVNKTYYQVPAWDGARLAGWVEIASKIPSLIKKLFEKGTKAIKNHIEVPESYFERTYGFEVWHKKSDTEQRDARISLLKQFEEFLTGEENSFKSFISFFDVDPHNKTEYGRIKITPIEDKVTLDKELITQSAADLQILIAAGVHPSLFSAGMTGSMLRSGGGSGSDIREAFLVYMAQLNLERNVMLEPLYAVRDYNAWDQDIVFRVRDTVLTTLDKGKGTEKVIS